jgi:hypothetical protein
MISDKNKANENVHGIDGTLNPTFDDYKKTDFEYSRLI